MTHRPPDPAAGSPLRSGPELREMVDDDLRVILGDDVCAADSRVSVKTGKSCVSILCEAWMYRVGAECVCACVRFQGA